ncbi:MAG TPA: hypothetical protein VI424_17855 [Terriglobales bacterium]|jgi:hypothetical protein
MQRHFVLAVLVLLLIPGIAQAHKKATRKNHHRTEVAANRRAARSTVADNAQGAEPVSNPIPLSWLLIILTSVVAVAFVAFTGMCLNVESPSSQARMVHTSRL